MRTRLALPFVAAAALVFGLAPVASGAPKKSKPSSKQQQQKPAPTPSKPAAEPKPPAGPGFSVVDGFITSVNVDAAGEITTISVKEVGRADNYPVFAVQGCGLKQAEHPVLLMAFEKYQRVWINVADGSKCYMGMLVSSPGK